MSTTPQMIKPETEEMATESNLPDGWADANLEGCSTLITKGTTPTSYGFKYKSSGISFVRVENLSDGYVDNSSITIFIDKDADQALKRSRLEAGDLLFSIAGTIGRTALVRPADLPANTNQALAIIRGTERIFVPQFLRFALASSLAQRQAQSDARGGGMNNISLEDVRSFRLPVPPFAEQERIVIKVGELFTQVNASRNRLAKVRLILKRFRQAVLAAACSGRLTEDWRSNNPTPQSVPEIIEAIRRRRESESKSLAQKEKLRQIYNTSEENDSSELPETWRFVALNKMCASFDYGTSAKSQPSGKVPVLRMGNIQSGRIDWTNLVYTSDPEEIRQYSLQPDTVLFNRTNSPELVGKTAIYRDERPAIFAGYLIRINQFQELDPRYLNLCLNTNYAREFCSQVKTDGVSQSNINAQKLGSFEVPFCPLAEQHQAVRRVDALLKLAETIEKRVEVAAKRADKLTQSILAKAFRGELVPTEAELARREGRDYEPASVSLERIRVERAKPLAPKTSDRKRRGGRANGK